MIPHSLTKFKQTLTEMEPYVSNYQWMWKVLRARYRKNGGWFPHKVHAALRHFGNKRRPFFICEFPDGLKFLGDYRDVNSMSYALVSETPLDIASEFGTLLKSKSGDILDIGANLGLYSAALGRYVKGEGRVFAFEPIPATVRRAEATLALNQLDNVFLFQAAVGDVDEEIVFYDAPNCSEYSSAIPTKQSIPIDWTEVRVPCVRLDTLYSENLFKQVSLVKIDAEGYEPKVIAGAKGLITSQHPPLIYEYNQGVAEPAGWKATDVAKVLHEWCGYQFEILRENGDRIPFNTTDDISGLVNILCRPTPASD